MTADERIHRRLRIARRTLDAALDDLTRVMERINRHRRRIARMESTLLVPAEIRRARARQGVATRRERGAPRRGIRVDRSE